MPPKKKLYGLESAQEERKERVIRDIRTPFQQFCQALLSREGFTVFSGFLLLWLVLSPGLWPAPSLIFFLLYTVRGSQTKNDHLPMRMPAVHNGLDFNNPAPGKGFKKSNGMFYIGNDVYEGNDELWIGKDDILTHMLVLGTTGAGKTETLVSLCFNYLAVGSGLIYVDPKAAPKLGAQIYTMARILGRDDDFLLINYMADKMAQESMLKHQHTRTPLRQSNTQNPFAVGDANQLTQLLFALMPGDDGGGNSIFQQNAQTLISGLMFVLVEHRNKGLGELSIATIRHYLMNIPEIDKLARDERYSETSLLALQAGLSTVGWDKTKALDKQPKNFPEQYSYARAYFGRALSLLVDNYGRIFNASHGEVDAVDVITSRRIYVTLIPSMDKDPKELKSLGQICLASVRNACAIGLGDKVQGRIADVLGALPTESRAPYGIIVDEYAAIETPGFEILLTQGRGLGMAVIVASQDMAGIMRASEAAAEQIVSNCKVKIFMTTEDPNKTFDLVQKLAGESFVLKSSGFSVDKDNSSSSNYFDNRSVSAERMNRVDFRDLQKQIEGDCTIFFKGELIRGRTFYASPPLEDDQDVRISYHLKCLNPDITSLRTRLGDLNAILEGFIARSINHVSMTVQEDIEGQGAPAVPKTLQDVVAVLKKARVRAEISANDSGISALMAFNDEILPKAVEDILKKVNDDDDFPRVGSATGDNSDVAKASEEMAGVFAEGTLSGIMAKGLIDKEDLASDIAEIESACGAAPAQAQEIAQGVASAVDASIRNCYTDDSISSRLDPSRAQQGLEDILSSMGEDGGASGLGGMESIDDEL